MTDARRTALLPDGLRDGLPPEAGYEAGIVAQLLAHFESYGYQRVDPPLIEFEDTLLGGAAPALSQSTFRLMDPVSQRMMGIRTDMTPQIGRIATTRLGHEQRPLRLAYAGPVLRVRGTQLRPERQFVQAGAELIGSDSAAADGEVVQLAAEALTGLGVRGLSIDINLPTLVPAVCADAGMDAEASGRVRAALRRKDADAVAAAGGSAAPLFCALLASAGPAADAFATLAALDLPAEGVRLRDRLEAVLELLDRAQLTTTLTVDPVEHRGFEYYTGLSFTIFARNVRGELGHGGQYAAGGAGEPSTGFSLYLDSLMRALPQAGSATRVYMPHGAAAGDAAMLRQEGWVVVAGLGPVGDAVAEARRLGCSHLFADGHVRSVRKPDGE